MGYPAKAVANYFLEKYGDEGISPLKMQKLVYIAHGWHMALYGVENPLVDDEYAEAWKYGPVFASLYHEFKHIGREPILELAMETDIDQHNQLKMSTPKVCGEDKEVCRLLDRIWEVYGGYSALKLSAMCHQKKSPWDEARNEGIRNAHIVNKEIQKYYKEKLNRNQDDG